MQTFDLAHGTRLAAHVSGDAEPVVVLLHAFPLDHSMWMPQIVHLVGRARVIAPDFRGFGASAAGDPGAPATMAELADDVAALLDNLKVTSAVVCGLSMGGYVALALLEKRPELFRALLLSDTRSEADSAEGAAGREAQAIRALAEGTRPLLDGLLEKLLGATTRKERPEVALRVRETAERCSPAAFAAAQRGMAKRADTTPLLASVKIPCTVVVGEEDVITDVAAAKKLSGGIAGSSLTVIEKAGHLSNIEAPEEWNRALDGVLGRLHQ